MINMLRKKKGNRHTIWWQRCQAFYLILDTNHLHACLSEELVFLAKATSSFCKVTCATVTTLTSAVLVQQVSWKLIMYCSAVWCPQLVIFRSTKSKCVSFLWNIDIWKDPGGLLKAFHGEVFLSNGFPLSLSLVWPC
jgi:hypothetical protein